MDPWNREGWQSWQEWLIYDPAVLPTISNGQYHDSSGINGFPERVFLGLRAMAAVLTTPISTTQRFYLWPMNFQSDGLPIEGVGSIAGEPALFCNGKPFKLKFERGKSIVRVYFTGDKKYDTTPREALRSRSTTQM